MVKNHENGGLGTSLDSNRITRTTYSSSSPMNSGFTALQISEFKQKCCCDPWAIRHHLVNTETGEMIPMKCNRYECLYCGPRKVSEWRALIKQADSERFITLTRVGGTLTDVSKVTHSVIQRLRRGARSGGRGRVSKVIRKPYEIEYLAVYEKHRLEANGFHIHILQKGDYIPQKEISEALMSATHGRSYIAHVEAISSSEVTGYVTKYMTKHLQNAEVGYRPDGTLARTRRIRYSHNFFPSAIGVMREDLRKEWIDEDIQTSGSWVLRETVELPLDRNGRVDKLAMGEQYLELVQKRASEIEDEAKQTRGGLVVLAYMLENMQIA